jgi:hypothetical protein
MVAQSLLTLTAVAVLAIVLPDVWQRSHGIPTTRRRQATLFRVGGASLAVALLGFEGALGWIPDPGVAADLAATLHGALLVCALAGFGGSWYIRRQLRDADRDGTNPDADADADTDTDTDADTTPPE